MVVDEIEALGDSLQQAVGFVDQLFDQNLVQREFVVDIDEVLAVLQQDLEPLDELLLRLIFGVHFGGGRGVLGWWGSRSRICRLRGRGRLVITQVISLGRRGLQRSAGNVGLGTGGIGPRLSCVLGGGATRLASGGGRGKFHTYLLDYP